MPCDNPETLARAAKIRLILFDVDGVLTDGAVIVHGDGSESKRFDIKDGTGIVLAQRAGLLTGLLSGRHSSATLHRAAQLGIPIVRQGSAPKLEVYRQVIAAEGLGDEAVAFMGDDLLDLPVLTRVGLSAAPADAVPDVAARVHWISRYRGGRGAARELIELVLRAQGRWDDALRPYAESMED